ncbi:hypothetical protein EDC14_101230 [Hydrogenispora ethanolica]|jgi:hypothetical protein|uniref:Uncharacterized protein n=1 Tax=Hydrogenispora ethanolica TaxID=1082276 RepID=A0A4R1RS94_HYDET|nr:hypothetical protein [Hydrogenispora ethanolica]TCL69333.1 hypothetical protein EDC14_101230 [Hydrogenispora ethanolica]
MKRLIVVSIFCFLLAAFYPVRADNQFSIHDAIQLCEENDVGAFVSVVSRNGFWQVKAINLGNHKPCELRINQETRIIDYCSNVTPREIGLGENTYGFSNHFYDVHEGFYNTSMVVNGFKIYKNNDQYFQMRKAIFIQNRDQFVGYYIFRGPGVIKGR